MTMQSNLSFVEDQTAHVEEQVYQIQYPDIQYPDLIDIDTSANPWAKTVTFYSMDGRGKADFVSGKAFDIPMVGTSMAQHESTVHLSAIGYDWGLEEVEQALELGINLDGAKASYARRAYEEMVDGIALTGNADKGWEGLYNNSAVTVVAAPSTGTGSSPLWANKTPELIIKDINDLITGVFTTTATVGLADTVLMPWERLSPLTTRVIENTSMTVLEFVRQNNLYTLQTGQPLKIRGQRGLLSAGGSSSARMIAYRKSPEVMKMHLPLALQFLPVQVQGLRYVVPGIFRLGGLDIRLPGEVRYMDGI